jgi:hypothetical protein
MTAKDSFQDWAVPSIGIRPGVVYGIGRDLGLTSKTTIAILAAAAGKPHTDGPVPLADGIRATYDAFRQLLAQGALSPDAVA